MKKNIQMAMAVAAVLLMTACGKPEKPQPQPDEDPVFPSLVEKSIQASSYVAIEFNANLDWELSIPTADLRWFYLDDNGMKEFKVKGQKGKASVKLYSEALTDNYEPHTTELTLKMGGKSEVIARVTITPAERTVEVFAAQTDANGLFVVSGTGDYEYESGKSESLMLQWPKGLTSYSLPIKVRSSFEWAIRGDYPEWLEPSKTTSEGEETELVLKGDPTRYPLDDAEGTITFTDIRNNDVVRQITVAIPGCKDLIFTDVAGGVIELNILGEYNSNGVMMPYYSFHVTSTLDTEVFACEKDGSTYVRPENPWLAVNVGFPEGKANENVIQDRVVTLSAGQNVAPEREAYIVVVPRYVLDSSDLNTVVSKYTVAQVRQAGLDPESGWNAIVPVNTDFQMAIKGAGIHRTAASEMYYAELSSKFGTNEIYTLEYNNWFSYEDVPLMSSKEVADVKFYLPDGSDEDYYGYLSVVNTDTDRPEVISVVVEYFEEGLEEAVVLYDIEGNVNAVIICRLTESYWPDVKFTDIRFVAYDLVGEDGDPDGNILPQNVLLERVSEGDIYEQYKEYGIPVWRLAYYTRTSERNAMIYVPPFPMGSEDAIESHPDPSWMKVEGALSEKGLPYIHVSMNDKLPETGNVGHIVLRGGGRPLFVLVCEREFMNN